MRKKQTSGFSLIELLVVIAIIGLLSSLLLTNFVGTRERAKDTRKKSDLNQMKLAFNMFYQDFQSYPAAGSGTTFKGCGDPANFSSCGFSVAFATTTTTYMKILPKDWRYYSSSDGQSFLLKTALDNVSDVAVAESQKRCCPSGTSDTHVGCSNIDVKDDYVLCED